MSALAEPDRAGGMRTYSCTHISGSLTHNCGTACAVPTVAAGRLAVVIARAKPAPRAQLEARRFHCASAVLPAPLFSVRACRCEVQTPREGRLRELACVFSLSPGQFSISLPVPHFWSFPVILPTQKPVVRSPRTFSSRPGRLRLGRRSSLG